jgi:hypothetical protein
MKSGIVWASSIPEPTIRNNKCLAQWLFHKRSILSLITKNHNSILVHGEQRIFLARLLVYPLDPAFGEMLANNSKGRLIRTRNNVHPMRMATVPTLFPATRLN